MTCYVICLLYFCFMFVLWLYVMFVYVLLMYVMSCHQLTYEVYIYLRHSVIALALFGALLHCTKMIFITAL